MRKLVSIILFSTFVFVSVPAVAVVARNARAEESQTKREEIRKRIEERKLELKAKIASRAALRKFKLEETKAKVCETKKRNIIRRSESMASRAEKQFKIFDRIVTKVDEYYNTRYVSQGKVLPNYQTLKDDITAKKEAAQVAVEAAKEVAKSFDCEADDPKGQLVAYREHMQEVIKALKNYRTSIKDFIVAIRTLNAKGGEATKSATQSSGSN